MRLRKKIVIFISAVAVIGLTVTYLLLHLILLNRFDKLDQTALQEKLNETIYSYQDELQIMTRQLLGYSVRDETYRFVESASSSVNPEVPYIKGNYNKAAYEINQFDMVALLNKNGRIIYGGTYDKDLGAPAPLSEELHGLLNRMINGLAPLTEAEESLSGVVLLGERPMLVVRTPIVNGDRSEPANGTAMAGRWLDRAEIARIGRGNALGLQVSPVSSEWLAKSKDRGTWTSPPTPKIMAVHTLIDDLFGEPGIVITVEQPRKIYTSGMKSVVNFRLFYFAGMLLMCMFSLIFVDRFILRRMASLVRNIRAITNSQNLSIRIKSTGKDEFSDLEHQFNRMISSLERAQRELRQQSMLDPLTQLPNRSLFFSKLNEAIEEAKRSRTQIVLLFIDLDHFKTVNDTLGHDFGDAMLKEIALRISEAVGPADVVSRLGGDEFTILLADILNSDEIPAKLSRIQSALAEPHMIQGHLLYNTASIGVSMFPENGEDADFLVKQADLAMLHVKESGRNHIFQYSEALERSVRRKNVLGQQLLSAAANHEFEVHYQPILSLSSGKVSKLEALLRWTSPTYGTVPPSEFIPLAESSGSIVVIGRWVLQQVCADLSRFREQGLHLNAAVNISGLQLVQPDLLETLLNLLKEYDLPPSSLELEITESVLIAGEGILQSLLALREHGFRISIDDFGTGFSSLSYLRRFPVDVIKIDRSFVSEITPEQPDDMMVKAIIELSHNLGLMVVSEGIELKEQFDMLCRLGSDELQGYYISKPVPASGIVSLLSQNTPFNDKNTSRL